MTLNINTDISEQIKKCDELIAKYEQLEEHAKQMHFVTVKEFAKMRGCSLSIARRIFGLPDFPEEDFGKEHVVSIEALKQWYMTKRSKKDYE